MGEILIPRQRQVICAHLSSAEVADEWLTAEVDKKTYVIGVCANCVKHGIAGVRLNHEGRPVLVLAE